jgi:hypothetical protein
LVLGALAELLPPLGLGARSLFLEALLFCREAEAAVSVAREVLLQEKTGQAVAVLVVGIRTCRVASLLLLQSAKMGETLLVQEQPQTGLVGAVAVRA